MKVYWVGILIMIEMAFCANSSHAQGRLSTLQYLMSPAYSEACWDSLLTWKNSVNSQLRVYALIKLDELNYPEILDILVNSIDITDEYYAGHFPKVKDYPIRFYLQDKFDENKLDLKEIFPLMLENLKPPGFCRARPTLRLLSHFIYGYEDELTKDQIDERYKKMGMRWKDYVFHFGDNLTDEEIWAQYHDLIPKLSVWFGFDVENPSGD